LEWGTRKMVDMVDNVGHLLPDFLCIGAQKAGTTWLYNQLVQHPSVSIPQKEINVLAGKQQIAQRYASFYSKSPPEALRGDVSPVYSTEPDIAVRAGQFCPNARFILLVRDPVERAFAQYCMATKAGRIAPDIPFRDAFDRNLQFMQRRGCYAKILSEFEPAIGRTDRFLIASFDGFVSAHAT